MHAATPWDAAGRSRLKGALSERKESVKPRLECVLQPALHVTLLGVNRQVNRVHVLVEHKLHGCATNNTMPLALKHAASAGLTKTSKPIKPSRATSAQLDRTGVLDARSVQTRAASLDAALLRHASTEALPNTAEDLFAPILRSSKNLPGAQPHRHHGPCRAGWRLYNGNSHMELPCPHPLPAPATHGCAHAEWAQRYMNLLAESTTTQGSMQVCMWQAHCLHPACPA